MCACCRSPSSTNTRRRCPCQFPVTLRWGNKVIGEKVTWFEGESDPALNSNVYQTANQIIVKHFPGERLIRNTG